MRVVRPTRSDCVSNTDPGSIVLDDLTCLRDALPHSHDRLSYLLMLGTKLRSAGIDGALQHGQSLLMPIPLGLVQYHGGSHTRQ